VIKIQAAGRGMLDRKRVADIKQGAAGTSTGGDNTAAADEVSQIALTDKPAVEPESDAGADTQAEGTAGPEQSNADAGNGGDGLAEVAAEGSAAAEPHDEAAPAAAVEREPEYTPEQQAAVIKIQAAGRGMLDRKRVADIKREAPVANDGADAGNAGNDE
jgi:hypothetical protein